MRQFLLIPIFCYLAFVCEFFLFNIFGRWGHPSLLLLIIIFFNLYSGIRHGVWAALWAGVLKDCFSTMPFGTHIFLFVASAYLSLLIRQYMYERGSAGSKLGMVFCLVVSYAVMMGFLHHMVFYEVVWRDVWLGIIFPQVVATLVVALFVFEKCTALAKMLKF